MSYSPCIDSHDEAPLAPTIPPRNLSVLPSFPQIRQQNLMTLYGSDRSDKSRAGHVDEHIQDLVDCINQHPFYVTLSSCSGRIALFDPATNCSRSDRNVIVVDSTGTRSDQINADLHDNYSGKGGGGSWLLVSHDVIDPELDLLPFFSIPSTLGDPSTIDDPEEDRICFLKLEPMLLHVAACNLHYGKLLLQVALQKGFRESGLIATDHRVTVAIRTNGLSLSIPLSRSFSHPLRPTSAYLKAVTTECNRRLRLNLQSLNRLYFAIQQKLFPLESPLSNTTTLSLPAGKIVVTAACTLPSLNLFGHSMVAIESYALPHITERDAYFERAPVTELLVFGGYGTGPQTPTTAADIAKPYSERSSNVYRMCRDWRLEWNTYWERIETIVPANERVISLDLNSVAYIQVQPVVWNARQSTAAFNLTAILPQNDCKVEFGALKAHILIFGGRYGPAKPLDDLLIYEYRRSPNEPVSSDSIGQVFRPLDIRGTLPSPRWGHSFTPFHSNCCSLEQTQPRPVALLIGGRQTGGICMDALFLLSLAPSDASAKQSLRKESITENFFYWEPLIAGDNKHPPVMQRFHHTTNWIDNDHMFVYGGLFHPDDLLSAFSLEESTQQLHDVDVKCAVILTLNKNGSGRFIGVNIDSVEGPFLHHRFGHTASSLTQVVRPATKEREPPKATPVVLLIGGVTSNSLSSNAAPLMECVQLVPNSLKGHWELRFRDLLWNVSNPTPLDSLDFGVLAHHCGVELRPDNAGMSLHDLRCSAKSMVLTGGGVSGFAFREAHSNSFLISVDMIGHYEYDICEVDLASHNVGSQVSRAEIPSSKVPNASSAMSQQCNVIYVLNRHAKQVKTTLEQLQLLNRQYRLSEIDLKGIVEWFGPEGDAPAASINEKEVVINTSVAVPVVAGGLDRILSKQEDGVSADLSSLADAILGYGNQMCLWRTGAFARGGR